MTSRKKRRTALPVSIIFRLILLVAASALLISYLSIFINPKITPIPLIFGLYFIPLVLLNLILLIVGIIRRSGATWIPFIILLPALFFGEMFFRWQESTPGNQGTTVTICSYNVGMFSHQSKVSRLKQIENVSRFMKKTNPDVLCIQEFFVRDKSMIDSYFTEYPYKYYHLFPTKNRSMFGNITYSKYPITGNGNITFKRSTNLCIYSDLEIGTDTIRIYNSHLESNNISFTSLIKRLSNTQDKSGEIIDLHDKLALTNKRRADQVDKVVDNAALSTYPAIICGDFNDTPISYTYHKLIKERKDSFKEAGKGFSATYSIFWPMLRIDYILFPKELWCSSHKTVKVPYSDHYPIFADIIIP